MSDTLKTVESWVAEARRKVASGAFGPRDLDELLARVRAAPSNGQDARPASGVRQRLLYLHATTPSIGSPLVGVTLHEPVQGGFAQMDPTRKDPEFGSVHDAIRQGWQVIHFPQQLAPFDDKEIDVLGYEFILQKLEPAPGSESGSDT
jgi:hypothetical protein